MKPLAIICKFYNEAGYLPIWLAHYRRQVGLENCYLLDHGSDDGSQGATGGANVVRLLRSPQDDNHHLDLIRRFARTLLGRYRYVLHVDIDELVVADPAHYPDLAHYAAACRHDVVSMIGLELQHVEEEPALNPHRPVLAQRRYVWFDSAMCKPALTNRRLDWSPGFHCMPDAAPFDDLYLFHLRYADRDIGLARLQRSRAQPWSHPDQARHQRMGDADWLGLLAGFGGASRIGETRAERHDPVVAAHLERVTASRAGRESQDYRIDLGIHSAELWRVPERFAALF